MLKFIETSISFKPAFDQKKSFMFTLTTFDGGITSTEPASYDPVTNVAVFSEILEIKPYFYHKNNIIVLELLQQEEIGPTANICTNTPNKNSKALLIAKRVIETNSNSLKEINSRPLVLRTTLINSKSPTPIEAIIKIGISIIKKFGEIETPTAEETGLLKPFLKEMQEFSHHQKGEFDILKANSINTDYLKKITPIVFMLNYFSDVFHWKSPVHTIIFALTVTLFTLYIQIILILSLLLFYINTPFFMRMLMKIPKNKEKNSIFERNKKKLYKLKRNITHIQEGQKDYIRKYDYFKNLLFCDDRTQLIELILYLRKYVLCFVAFLLVLSPINCFLVIFWLILCKNSAYGKTLIEEIQRIFQRINDEINKKIDYIVLRFRIFPILPEAQSNRIIHSDRVGSQGSQKTFVIYENQRWWLGKGWTDLLLPGERTKYSDIEGILSLNFDKLSLPEPEEEWAWEGDWQVEVNDDTDSEGWLYAYDFKNEFHAKNSKLDYARRRKWFRKCSKK